MKNMRLPMVLRKRTYRQVLTRVLTVFQGSKRGTTGKLGVVDTAEKLADSAFSAKND
jgi:hypothetical protein